MQAQPKPSNRFTIMLFAMIALFWMQFQMTKRAAEQQQEMQRAQTQQSAPAAAEAEPVVPGEPTAAMLAVFPPEVAGELQLADPAWATLAPTEQLTAMRVRQESLGKDPQAQGRMLLTVGFLYESALDDNLAAAREYAKLNRYAMDPKNRYDYAGQGLLRASELFTAIYRAGGTNAKAARKQALSALNTLVTADQKAQTTEQGLMPLWGRWGDQGLAATSAPAGGEAPTVGSIGQPAAPGSAFIRAGDPYRLALWRIDQLSREQFVYKVIDGLVRAMKAIVPGLPGLAHVLALLLLALGLNLITFPLSRMSQRSMREMQRVAPLLKEIQTRYKDDPQRASQEQMKLYRDHNINPLSGCLPMLVQMPVFIFVYQGIRAYTYHYLGAKVMWIESLAKPDLPLLLAYGVSMFFTQKLMMSMQPPADPQQAAMQKTMAWMMPVMFTFMMYSWNLPSAFYFYWLAFNILTTIVAVINRRTMPPLEALTAAPAAAGGAGGGGGGGTASAGPSRPRGAGSRPAGRAKAKGKKRGGRR